MVGSRQDLGRRTAGPCGRSARRGLPGRRDPRGTPGHRRGLRSPASRTAARPRRRLSATPAQPRHVSRASRRHASSASRSSRVTAASRGVRQRHVREGRACAAAAPGCALPPCRAPPSGAPAPAGSGRCDGRGPQPDPPPPDSTTGPAGRCGRRQSGLRPGTAGAQGNEHDRRAVVVLETPHHLIAPAGAAVQAGEVHPPRRAGAARPGPEARSTGENTSALWSSAITSASTSSSSSTLGRGSPRPVPAPGRCGSWPDAAAAAPRTPP